MLELAEAIDVRRSVRDFEERQLTVSDQEKVRLLIDQLKPLSEDCPISFHFLDNGKNVQAKFHGLLDHYFKVKAPAYVVITGEKKPHYLENAGYMGEELVLRLTQMNIGTCWVGSIGEASIPKDFILAQGHEFIITIALGYCEESFNTEPLRKGRKPHNEFVVGDYEPELLTIFKAIEKAPSAMNSQPWVLLSESEHIHFYMRNTNIFTKKVLKNFNYIDMGIAMKHFEVEMHELRKEFFWQDLGQEPYQGHSYIYSASF